MHFLIKILPQGHVRRNHFQNLLYKILHLLLFFHSADINVSINSESKVKFNDTITDTLFFGQCSFFQQQITMMNGRRKIRDSVLIYS